MRYPAYLLKEGRTDVALFPDCHGCQTQANRGEKIAIEAEEALEGWLAAELQARRVPPRPNARPRAPKGGKLLWVEVAPRLSVRLSMVWARADAGLSQAELARRAGVSQQAIAKIEHPDSNPTLETLQRVAAALGAR